MQNVQSIGIVGAGQMGRGIAQVAAMSGYTVQIYDVSAEGLKKGVDFIEAQLKKGVEKAKWDQAFVEKTMKSISTVTDMSALKNCDLLIEAATENKTIKFEFIIKEVL